MINIESIKAKIRNLAKNNNLSSQEVLQMFLFERFLERLSKSKYKSNLRWPQKVGLYTRDI